MKHLASIMILAAMLAAPFAAFAETSSLEDVLRAIDTVPTRAQLDEAFLDATARLKASVEDRELDMYARHRAITLLSLYPTPQTRSFLESLAAGSSEAEIRKMAVYTLGRAFGTPGDPALVETIGKYVRDAEPVVREWAVRSLRWVAHPDAKRLLEELVRTKSPALQSVARRALRKRSDAATFD